MTRDEILAHFRSVIADASWLLASVAQRGRPGNRVMDTQAFYSFKVRAMNIVKRACGEGEHYAEMARLSKDRTAANPTNVMCYLGVLEGAQKDFEAGRLTEIRMLVAAEVLGDFLEQAEELLAGGFHVAAASLAGAVLADTLRKLCDRKKIPFPPKTKIDSLNAELTRAGVYSKGEQNQITAHADLRNLADHGRFEEVKAEAVAEMVRWIRRFCQEQLRAVT